MENNENKLPEDFKRKWVAALRSGEYKQCTGKLHKTDEFTGENSFCCLGVGYHVATGKIPVFTHSGYIYGNTIDTKGVPALLIGDGHEGSGDGSAYRFSLTKMNDNGKSFSEIADYIEQNL